MRLSKEEMLSIKGGGINVGAGLLIAAGVTFFIGIVDGLTRPFRCR